MALRMVCISDTHGEHTAVDLPAGDVLVHAGDITAHGTEADLEAFLAWFAATDFAHRLFVAGNHDTFLEQAPARTREMVEDFGLVCLNDSGCEIDGIHFWGSPITPRFHDWAFMRDPGAQIERHWQLIPSHTDVLITHGPPFGILDQVERSEDHFEHTGCESLLKTIESIKPRYHIFGHIHEAYGRVNGGDTEFLNVSTMNRYYRIKNAPVEVDISHSERDSHQSKE